VRDDTGERRKYERLAGNGASVTVRSGGKSAQVELLDMSRGGALLDCDWSLPVGSPMEIRLPGTSGVVKARVVRHDRGRIVAVFISDPAALAEIDRAIEWIGGRSLAA
jgi:hypothetical protein